MARIESPCLDCNNRHVGCHGECDKYLSYKIDITNHKTIVEDNKARDKVINSYKSESIMRMRKKKKR